MSRKVITIIILVLVFLLSLWAFINFRYSVKITITPGDAVISVDGKKINKNPTVVRKSKGTHTIIATKPGYFDLNQPINVDKNLDISLALAPLPSPQVAISSLPQFSKVAWIDSTSLVGYNSKDNRLYLVNVQVSQTTPLDTNSPALLTNLFVTNEKVVLFAKASSSAEKPVLKLYDLKTKLVSEINLLETPSSVSFSPDGSNISFLSEIGSNSSNLHIVSLSSAPVEQQQTFPLPQRFTYSVWLDNSTLGLVTSVDAAYANSLSLYSISNHNLQPVSVQFSTLNVSRKTGKIILHGKDGLTLVSKEGKTTFIFPFQESNTTLSTWLSDEEFLLISTDNNQAKISIINTSSGSTQQATLQVPDQIGTLVPSPAGDIYYLTPNGRLTLLPFTK